MSYDVAGTIAEVVEALAGIDVHASPDLAAVQAPGVWLMPMLLEPSFCGASGFLTIDLYLLAGAGLPFYETYPKLDALLEKVTGLFATEGDYTLNQSVSTGNGGEGLPAYKVTIKVPTI